MRINFHKCDLIPSNVEDDQDRVFAHTLSCRLGKSPLKYLGVPLHHKKTKERGFATSS